MKTKKSIVEWKYLIIGSCSFNERKKQLFINYKLRSVVFKFIVCQHAQPVLFSLHDKYHTYKWSLSTTQSTHKTPCCQNLVFCFQIRYLVTDYHKPNIHISSTIKLKVVITSCILSSPLYLFLSKTEMPNTLPCPDWRTLLGRWEHQGVERGELRGCHGLQPNIGVTALGLLPATTENMSVKTVNTN